jgi:hypothetical protein
LILSLYFVGKRKKESWYYKLKFLEPILRPKTPKIQNAMSSLVRFEKKNIFFYFYLKPITTLAL